MSNASQELAEVLALCREDFTAFCLYVWKGYSHSPHIELMQNELMKVTRFTESFGKQGTPLLSIAAPPRHSKSTTIQLFCAWWLGRNPTLNIIVASYSSSLAIRNSRKVRQLIKSPRFALVFPGVSLDESSRAKNQWAIARHGGGLLAVGQGSSVIGFGCSLLVLDDMIKGRSAAESQLQRDNVFDFVSEDLMTRREPNAGVVSVGTRYHLDDPAGRLELTEGDLWRTIKLTAIAEGSDILGRVPGAALWPSRFPIEVLQDMRRRIGEYSFSALYQCNPVPSEGGLFKRSDLVVIDHEPTDIIRKVRAWDLSFSAGGDYTSGLLLGVTSTDMYVILDIVHRQIDWSKACELIAKTALSDGTSVGVFVESYFYQGSAVKQLLKDVRLLGHTIKGVSAPGSKFERALPVSARIGQRMVSVMRRNWTEEFISEAAAFPLAKNDDMVDSLSIAYQALTTRQPITVQVSRWAGFGEQNTIRERVNQFYLQFPLEKPP